MSAMDIDLDLSSVLADLRANTESADVAQLLYQLEDYYERKLWNQLTLALEDFFAMPESHDAHMRQRLFDDFLARFQNKLNPTKVVDFVVQCFAADADCLAKLKAVKADLVAELSRKHNSRRSDDAETAIANDEAVIYASLQIARYLLLVGDGAEAEAVLETVSGKFDGTLQNDFSSKTNAAYYLTKCEHFKLKENHNAFYTNGLLYLSLVAGPMAPEERVAFCYDLCVAALLGDKIYNFGELILHDILQSINDQLLDYFWLYNLVLYLNAGNLAKFNEWLAVAYEKSPHLAAHQQFLHQKIIIMALLELISTKLTTQKQLLFAEISSFTGTPESDVELLIIKCFALGLVRGHINQIDQILVVTWLHPRILNLDQVKVLYNHLVEWDASVKKLSESVLADGSSVIASA